MSPASACASMLLDVRIQSSDLCLVLLAAISRSPGEERAVQRHVEEVAGKRAPRDHNLCDPTLSSFFLARGARAVALVLTREKGGYIGLGLDSHHSPWGAGSPRQAGRQTSRTRSRCAARLQVTSTCASFE